jgi:hypothetical protein
VQGADTVSHREHRLLEELERELRSHERDAERERGEGEARERLRAQTFFREDVAKPRERVPRKTSTRVVNTCPKTPRAVRARDTSPSMAHATIEYPAVIMNGLSCSTCPSSASAGTATRPRVLATRIARVTFAFGRISRVAATPPSKRASMRQKGST